MTELPTFANLAARAMDKRTSMQQLNTQTRDDIASALRADRSPTEAMPSPTPTVT
jgi:hypothetical protein